MLKGETETAIKNGLVMRIEILLNIMFIALQDGREKNQKGLSKQSANATLLFIKSTLWAQRI